jgi:hypothetical protein
VPLLSRDKERAVERLILKIINNHCSEVGALFEGPRLDSRVSLVVVVLVVPLEQGKPALPQAFAAVTKEFSASGVSLVLPEPLGLDKVVLGFRWENEMKWMRATARHLSPLGAGFYQVGFRLTEIVCVGDCPELRSLQI